MRYGVLAGIALLFLAGSDCSAADLPQAIQRVETETEAPNTTPRERSNSVYFFAGRLSTTSLGSTLRFNLDHPSNEITYDNYIAGAAYTRDIYRLGLGFTLGAEIGGAVRAGSFALCCNPVVKSSSWVNSEELWIGPRISHEGFVFFNTVRLAGATTWGLSFANNSIGYERGREIAWSGSARTLFYFGPEIIVALQQFPDFEFVYRLHHRSGANGKLGNLREGYNANVFGIRYKF
ncbi:hypothetical protein JQ629_36225 [Bradyrhizobium sp. AUGA SZCCT0222]|uniref:hypothetical protein n=1 Tax=Bradyrhizobium sp. AUGA SZCCT0222 TaxID=2807668 RepID=UPI001BA94F33|nr:hypothetical protein [Bradyrhizobium sp. AUGA SZCCT0222]MBR1272930.1 hypothetical protein [Bradyrhizobium sp. AUGA SZCCT0222]